MSEKMNRVSEGGNSKEGGKAPNNPIHNAQEDLSQIDWDIRFLKNQGIPIKAIREMKKFIPSIEYINMMKIIKHLLDMGHEIELLYQEFIESEILKGYLCSIENERLSFYWTKKILDSNNEINIGKIYEIINRLNSYEGIFLTKKNIIYILQRMLDFYIRYKKEKWNKRYKKKGNDTDIETFLMELGNAKGSDSINKNYDKIKDINHINKIIISLKENLNNIEQTRPKKGKKYDCFLKYYLDNIDYINYHILKIKKEKDIENVIVTSIDNKLETNKKMLDRIRQHRDNSNCYFDASEFENGYEIIGLHELLETESNTNNSDLSEIEDEISYAHGVLFYDNTYSEFIKRYPPKESRIKDLHKSLKSLHEKRETYSLEYKEEKFNDLLDEMIKGIDNILFTLQTSVKIEETEMKRLLRLLKHSRTGKKLLMYIRKIENEDVHKELFNDFIEECKINMNIDENKLNYFKFIDDNEYLRLFFAVYPNEKKMTNYPRSNKKYSILSRRNSFLFRRK